MSPAMKRVLERLHDIAGGRSTSEFRVVRKSDSLRITSEMQVPPAPSEGAGTYVTVVQSASTLLPGVRAFMAIQRLRELGVTHVLLDRGGPRVPYPRSLVELVQDSERLRRVYTSQDGRFVVCEVGSSGGG